MSLQGILRLSFGPMRFAMELDDQNEIQRVSLQLLGVKLTPNSSTFISICHAATLCPTVI
jgi:hypothetical protein